MELRNLRADITSLEAASGLTVDDILGIMQDLWGDVRHESGRAAEDNPVRDADELTSKLIWACNQLVKITGAPCRRAVRREPPVPAAGEADGAADPGGRL